MFADSPNFFWPQIFDVLDFTVFFEGVGSVHKGVFLWKSVRLAALTKDTAPRIRGDESAQCGGRSCSRKRTATCITVKHFVNRIPRHPLSNDLATYARQKQLQSFTLQ